MCCAIPMPQVAEPGARSGGASTDPRPARRQVLRDSPGAAYRGSDGSRELPLGRVGWRCYRVGRNESGGLITRKRTERSGKFQRPRCLSCLVRHVRNRSEASSRAGVPQRGCAPPRGRRGARRERRRRSAGSGRARAWFGTGGWIGTAALGTIGGARRAQAARRAHGLGATQQVGAPAPTGPV